MCTLFCLVHIKKAFIINFLCVLIGFFISLLAKSGVTVLPEQAALFAMGLLHVDVIVSQFISKIGTTSVNPKLN